MEASSAVELPSPPRVGGSTAKLQKKQPGSDVSPKARSKRQGMKSTKNHHPSYSQMINEAIAALKDRKGSSRVAILKYISHRYQLSDNGKRVHSQLRLAIKRGIASGKLMLAKGAGVNGSFRLGNNVGNNVKKGSSRKQKPSKREKKTKTSSASPKKPRMKETKTAKNSPKRRLKANKPKPKKAS
ncbi:unnamed protein product [Litomosoides sigmodontis]|uniref:H15 domain-containing protein n=1 Tax=Litomosoides sigmodontis TaxID=42156 RepID=A0A3P6T338_LITSI|nr:unnamed protein product [Litomosoides sigmodontis]